MKEIDIKELKPGQIIPVSDPRAIVTVRPTGEFYKRARQEVRELNKSEKLGKQQLIVLEKAIFNDLMVESGVCRKCNRDKNLTLDHIVPRDILRQFGVDVDREIIDGNYQLLCRMCNTFKANRMDFSVPETKEILEQLIKERL